MSQKLESISRWILLITNMSNLEQSRKTLSSHKYRTSQPLRSTQEDISAKYYRYLSSIFSYNLSKFIGKHAVCFDQLETPNRSIVNREQLKKRQNQAVKLFPGYHHRLTRQMLNRNIPARIAQQDYQKYFQTIKPEKQRQLYGNNTNRIENINQRQLQSKQKHQLKISRLSSAGYKRRSISACGVNIEQNIFRYRNNKTQVVSEKYNTISLQSQKHNIFANESFVSTKESAKKLSFNNKVDDNRKQSALSYFSYKNQNKKPGKTQKPSFFESKNPITKDHFIEVKNSIQFDTNQSNFSFTASATSGFGAARKMSLNQKKVIKQIQQMYARSRVAVKHMPSVVVARSQVYNPTNNKWLNIFNK